MTGVGGYYYPAYPCNLGASQGKLLSFPWDLRHGYDALTLSDRPSVLSSYQHIIRDGIPCPEYSLTTLVAKQSRMLKVTSGPSL